MNTEVVCLSLLQWATFCQTSPPRSIRLGMYPHPVVDGTGDRARFDVLYSIRLYFHHQSHPQLGVFSLWLCLFILSGVISPLISSSILGTYRPGEFPLQYRIILPFHAVHGVLKARILKWFAIPFSSGPHSVRPLHHDPPILGGPTGHGLVSLS